MVLLLMLLTEFYSLAFQFMRLSFDTLLLDGVEIFQFTCLAKFVSWTKVPNDTMSRCEESFG
jgi:hypothetical protein